MRLRSSRFAAAVLAAAMSGPGLFAADRALADASLEDLMKIEVTSVSRKRQLLSKSAAAVYVLTQEDIARSGATSIPEVLRLVPGLMVARIDSNKWAVGARGESGRFSNKMLVLIDGRTVYTNLYSGVYWDQNDTLLEDVERIEIIRGPGGTMWGANAVNAVINIITKSAQQTQGMLATVGGGTQDRGFGAIRYGGETRDAVHYRGYVKYFNRGSLLTDQGLSAHDEWDSLRGGGRLEWAPSRRDRLTVHGDLYRGRGNENVSESVFSLVPGPAFHGDLATSGGYALGRWEHSLAGGSDLAFQSYIQRENRDEAMGRLANLVGDIDFQHHAGIGARHDVLWGAAYRLTTDTVSVGPATASLGKVFVPESRRDSLYSAFLQDEFGLLPGRLILTAGTKLQHNDYTGFEVQPNVRMLWTPNPRHSVWAAVSRAVRTPSRRDHDLAGLPFELPPPAPAGSVGLVQGNRAFRSETLLAHEAGWRWQPGNRVSLDLSGYVGQMRGLQKVAAGVPWIRLNPTVQIVLPLSFSNAEAEKRGGVELASTFQMTRKWRIHANYSWYRPWDTVQERTDINTFHLQQTTYREHQAQFRSSWEVRRGVSLDCNLFALSGMPGSGINRGVRADVRLAVRAGEATEWSVGLQDLFDARRSEFGIEDYVRNSQVARAISFKLTWGR
jgi:iron complex outermembrane recepter protein